MKYIINFASTTSLILFMIIFGHSQSSRIFAINLAEMNLRYSEPPKFKAKDSSYSFFFYTKNKDKKKEKYLYPMTYRIISKEDNMIIGFTLLPLKIVDDSSIILKRMYPGRKKNEDYLLKIKHKLDTLKGGKLIEYSQKESNDKFKADKSGTYSIYLEIPYDGKYHYCSLIYLHKENVGDAEIYYFHTKRNKAKISKYLENASQMLSFKN